MKINGRTAKSSDKNLLIITGVWVFVGFLVFISAALGLHGSDSALFREAIESQLLGLLLGAVGLIVCSNIPYTFWRKMAIPAFTFAASLMVLVLLPFLGVLHGGSRRWIYIGSVSFQPAVLFKIAAVILYAAWLSKHKERLESPVYALLPLGIIAGISAFLLFLQPKIGTFIVIAGALGAELVVAPAKKRFVAFLMVGLIALGGLAYLLFPYARERVDVFLHPSEETLGTGYQIEQAMIAVGSGRVFGRGYGQSIQKFDYLPEPLSDSIFAVAAEELGFIGASAIIVLVTLFTLFGLRVAARAPDLFSRLLVIGLVILISVQSFFNIATMIGLMPISGMPLTFVSRGGTALAASLASVGIILNVSKYSGSYHNKNRS